ncbi:MAG: ABC transporter substrate-binding protein [Flavobacteriales bacterium]|nr:ABC transporter substrate-binding protein [Flavobacteriales bacterium]
MRTKLLLLFLVFIIACQENPVLSPRVSTSQEEAQELYAQNFSLRPDGDGGFHLGVFFKARLDKPDVLDSSTCDYYLHIDSGFQANRVAALSTTHASLLDKSGALESLKAVGFADLVRNENTRDLIDKGEIAGLSASNDADFEIIVELDPQIYLVYPFGNSDYSRYEELGIKCIPICEYLEPTPLGRAEWMKVIGVLTGKYPEACSAFGEIERQYVVLRNHVNNQVMPKNEIDSLHSKAPRPVVFAGSFDQGKWFAPPGNSFTAEFIKDAGGQYLFDETSQSGNLELEFEELFERAYDADWWGKVIYEEGELTLDKLKADDERLSRLKAFRNGKILYCNTYTSDYFGDGIVEPHIILADLISILHPEMIAEHTAVYFQSLSAQ